MFFYGAVILARRSGMSFILDCIQVQHIHQVETIVRSLQAQTRILKAQRLPAKPPPKFTRGNKTTLLRHCNFGKTVERFQW